MPDVLKSAVAFANVAAGATVALPHGLFVANRGGSVVPDEIKSNNGNIEILGADDTDVTVRNNSAAPASAAILCEAWHSFERAFPGGQGVVALVPQPFIPAGGGGGVAATPALHFVFRPGGVAAGNVYTDWNTLVAALQSVAGWKILEFDPTALGANISIPAGGPYDMTEVEWFASQENALPGASVVTINIPEGATFNQLRYFRGDIFINVQATATVPDQSLVDNDVIRLMDNAQIERNAPGAVPMWSAVNFVATDAVTVLLCGTGAAWLGPGPLIHLPVAGTTVRMNVQVNSSAETDTVSGVVGSTLFWFVNASTALISRSQVNFLGTQIDFPLTNLRMLMDEAAVAGNQNLTRNEFGRFNTTAAPRVANLPTAASMGRGQFVGVVNELGANNVVVTATGGNTVNGGATNNVLPGTAALYVSDGISAWFRVG